MNDLPILIFDDTTGIINTQGLPAVTQNIFQRIVRNPRPDSPNARERECTEMLAAVLLNAPTLRQLLFRWMAKRSGSDPNAVDPLEFEITTEQYIGAKRDDLRIEGFKGPGRDDPVVVWTVEVKVGSSFHLSRIQHLVAEGEESADPEQDIEAELELVNQLKHYDDWLTQRRSSECGGFVLALRDLSDTLPSLSLRQCWTCLTWTALGLEIQAALESDDLADTDHFLAKHLLGFITTHLWRTEEMPDATLALSFNDVAFIRALSQIGKECERKIIKLVDISELILTKSSVGVGDVKKFNGLYKSETCSGVYRFLTSGLAKEGDPFVSVVFGGSESVDYFGVYLEVPATYAKREAVRKAVVDSIKMLQTRDSRWDIIDEGEGRYVALELSSPLTDLLSALDQQKHFEQFVTARLDDLKLSGAIGTVATAAKKK